MHETFESYSLVKLEREEEKPTSEWWEAFENPLRIC